MRLVMMIFFVGSMALLSCGLFGCTIPSDEEISTSVYKSSSITTVKYDGCEYIQYWTGKQWGMIHKGNCINHLTN